MRDAFGNFCSALAPELAKDAFSEYGTKAISSVIMVEKTVLKSSVGIAIDAALGEYCSVSITGGVLVGGISLGAAFAPSALIAGAFFSGIICHPDDFGPEAPFSMPEPLALPAMEDSYRAWQQNMQPQTREYNPRSSNFKW